MPSSISFFARPRFSSSLFLKLLFILFGILAFRSLLQRVLPLNTNTLALPERTSFEPQGVPAPNGYIYSGAFNPADFPGGVLAACADPQGNNGFFISAYTPSLHQVSIRNRENMTLVSNHVLSEGIDEQGTVAITTDSTGRDVLFGLGSGHLYYFDTLSQQTRIIANVTSPINSIVVFNQRIIAAHNSGVDIFSATALPDAELLDTYHLDLVGYGELAAPTDGVGPYFAAVLRDSTGMDIFSLDPNTGNFSLATSYRMEIGWSVISTVLANGLVYTLTLDPNNTGILQIMDPSQTIATQNFPLPIAVHQGDSLTITNGVIQIGGQQGINAFSISDSILTNVGNYDWGLIEPGLSNPNLFLFTDYDTMAFWNYAGVVVVSAMPQILVPQLSIEGSLTLSLEDFFISTSILNLNDIRVGLPAISTLGFTLPHHPNGIFSAAELLAGTVSIQANNPDQLDSFNTNTIFQLLLPHHANRSWDSMQISYTNPSQANDLSPLAVALPIGILLLCCFVGMYCRSSSRNEGLNAMNEEHKQIEDGVRRDSVQLEQPTELKSIAQEPSDLEKAKEMIKKYCTNLAACLQDHIISLDWFSDDEINQLKCDHVLSDEACLKLLAGNNNVCCPDCRTVTPPNEVFRLKSIGPLVQACKDLIIKVEAIVQLAEKVMSDQDAQEREGNLIRSQELFQNSLEDVFEETLKETRDRTEINLQKVKKFTETLAEQYNAIFVNLEKYVSLQKAAPHSVVPSSARAELEDKQKPEIKQEQIQVLVESTEPETSASQPEASVMINGNELPTLPRSLVF